MKKRERIKKAALLYDSFVKENGTEPLYATCIIRYNEDKENALEVVIKLSHDSDENDDKIFYYSNGIGEITNMFDECTGEDFVICEVTRFFSEF